MTLDQQYPSGEVLMGTTFGVEYPEAFTHPLIEYRALTTRAGLIDLSHWGALRLTGADRVTLLNNMITCDISSLAGGHGRHGALATLKGRLVAELVVMARANELFVLVPQGDVDAVAETLDRHIIADDVILENVSKQFGVVSVEGPKCREVVWRLIPDAPVPLEPFQFTDTEYQGTPVTVLRHGVTGEKGMQVIVPTEGLPRIRDYLVQSGIAEDMELCGRASWNMRRIEAGLPWWGADVVDSFPKECRLDHLVDYQKGCYLGQETLARMHFRGHPNWLLVGLRSPQIAAPDLFSAPDDELPTVEADPDTVRRHIDAIELRDVVERGTELYAGSDASAGEGKPAGRITSCTFSPALGCALLLGSVREKMAETGTEFVFSTGDEVTKTTITHLPVEDQTK